MITLGPIFDFDTSGKFFELVKTSPMRQDSEQCLMLWRFQAQWHSSPKMPLWAL